MSDERWDVPSEKLRRMAGGKSTMTPVCESCRHRHSKGVRCGYPPVHGGDSACRCQS